MTKWISAALAALAVASAQTPVQVQPAPALARAAHTKSPEAARPLLGYSLGRSGDGANLLHSVVGSADSPSWGEPLLLPQSTEAAFLPPRQEYALLASDAGLSVARLSRSAVYPGIAIPGSMPKPEHVSFSPSGDAAALFSNGESRIQIIYRTAEQARVLWSIAVDEPGSLVSFAISDDGALLIAASAGHSLRFSLSGSKWQDLGVNYSADALTFLPASHDLVLSDRVNQAIVLLPAAERAPIAARVLAGGGIAANLLAPNKHGSALLAVAAGTSSSWSIDLLNGVVTALPPTAEIDSLALLRDGQTFLVSKKNSPALVKLSGEAAQAAAGNISR